MPSKNLEALEVIECILSNHQIMLEAKDKRFEFINIIKQDLQRKEQLEKENQDLKERNIFIKTVNKNALNEMRNLIDEKHKLKKAIEILAAKRVNIDYLLNSSECPTYNFYADDFSDLTQQEFELLKEVLGE